MSVTPSQSWVRITKIKVPQKMTQKPPNGCCFSDKCNPGPHGTDFIGGHVLNCLHGSGPFTALSVPAPVKMWTTSTALCGIQ